MKKLNLLLLVLLPLFVAAQKITVKIEIKHHKAYCGGMRPSEEMEAELSKLKPLANTKFIIVRNKKIVKTLTTDSEGVLSCRLKKGDYKIYEAWRYNLETPNNLDPSSFDKNCLITEWEKVYGNLHVEKRNTAFFENYAIYLPCDWQLPCLTTEIPIPPMAPPRPEE